MTLKTIPLTAVSVQQSKPDTRFGQPAILPVASTSQILALASLSGIPTGATVQEAWLVFRSRNNPTWAGARTMKARRALAKFSTATTWNTKPTTTLTDEASTSITAAPFGTFWRLRVDNIVQAWVSGTQTNFGFVIFTSDTNLGQMQGVSAPWGPPVLEVTYVTTAVTPTALHPSSGAVNKQKPTVTFQAAADTPSIQVQVDPAANGTTPGFDSGEVASTAGLLDLSRTDLPGGAYAGLADGATTQWRARAKNALGWSDWSAWVSFSRAAWKTLTVASPTSTSEDPSPVITATYGGTVTSWRAILKDNLGAIIQDSGWTPGVTPAFGTTKAVGASGTAVVQVRDDTVRDATPGDPDYVEDEQAFTVTPSGTPSVLTSLAATSPGPSPIVVLTASRASGVPDEVAIYRDNVLVDRQPGASLFSGTTMTYSDKTATMNVQHTYKVYAVVNGAWSNASSTATVTPTCLGVWLFDADPLVTDSALILEDDGTDPEQTQPEISIVHRPISGPDGKPQVVRRRLSRYPREGSISGLLVDAEGVSAADSETALRAWADYDAGHIYRLVLGNQNDRVILGDIDFDEVSENGGANGRVLGVSLGWWVQN